MPAGVAEAPQDDSDRPVLLDGLRRDVLALRWRVFFGRGKRDPQLEGAQRLAWQRSAVMPDAVTGLHPLQPAGRDLAILSRGVFVGEASSEDRCKGRDPGVGMDAEEWLARSDHFTVVQEHERLDPFADIGRAHKPRDGAVPAAAGP